MAKLGSREFLALLVLSMFALSAVSAAAGSANFLKQKNAEKYFEKLSPQIKPAPTFINNFISKLPFFAKKTETTTTTTTTTQSSGFCGYSSYGSCSTSSDCKVSGCSAQQCVSIFDSNNPGSTCDMKECYYSDGKYYMKCGCLKNQCQWARPYQFSNPNQGQGQGSGGSGNGNGQSSQGPQGTGAGESQSQSYGEGDSFQCLNLDEEEKCIDSEGVHQYYCVNVGGCFTPHSYHCGDGENNIHRCVADAVPAVCKSSCQFDLVINNG